MNAGRMVCNVRWHHTKVIMWCSEERGWGCIISNNKLHKQTISQGHSDLRVNGSSGSGDQGGAAGCRDFFIVRFTEYLAKACTGEPFRSLQGTHFCWVSL